MPPPARARFACATGAGGPCPLPGICILGRSQGGVIGGSPRCPAARRRRVLLGGGYPSPFPPFAAARVRCGRPFGGAPRLRPSAVGLPRSDSSMGAPLWFLVSPSRGVSRWCSQGFPPAPSLRALGVRFWVEDPPLPSPPCRPLALGALDRSGGGPLLCLSVGRCPLCARSTGGLSPPSSRWVCPLCHVVPWASSSGAGPAMSYPPTDAAVASLPYSRCGRASLSVVAAAASVECAGRCSAPPDPSDFSISASCVAVAPRRAAPSLPSVSCSLVFWAVGGFSSPPPRPRPSSPRRYRDAVGAPRVLSPLGPSSSLGVDLSHDDLTPPPFSFGVKSSCHDLTPPTPPLGVESSWDDSTPPPSPWRVESSRDNSTPPPTTWRPLPGFSSTPEA